MHVPHVLKLPGWGISLWPVTVTGPVLRSGKYKTYLNNKNVIGQRWKRWYMAFAKEDKANNVKPILRYVFEYFIFLWSWLNILLAPSRSTKEGNMDYKKIAI